MNPREQFEKETGLELDFSYCDDPVCKYVEWLEEKQTPKGLEERK